MNKIKQAGLPRALRNINPDRALPFKTRDRNTLGYLRDRVSAHALGKDAPNMQRAAGMGLTNIEAGRNSKELANEALARVKPRAVAKKPLPPMDPIFGELERTRPDPLGPYGLGKRASMDQELAYAVFQRWQEGAPVAETTFYKAASALGVDPAAALLEARYYTALDSYLLEKRAMTAAEQVVFAAASGTSLDRMEKTASAYGLSSEELILEALYENRYVPNIDKLAAMAAIGAAQPMQPMQPMQQAAQVMGAPPSPDMQVQQAPEARESPTPTAPQQMPAQEGGNFDALLQESQQIHGQGAEENGGMAAAGMPEPPPPPPSPEERLSQVAPGMDPETQARYGEQLAQLEQQMGMPVTDPKQMVKFVKELQKADAKKIDQGIKEMGQQLAQEQTGISSMGVASPAGGQGPGQAPPANPQPAANAAVEKVAHVARILARSRFR